MVSIAFQRSAQVKFSFISLTFIVILTKFAYNPKKITMSLLMILDKPHYCIWGQFLKVSIWSANTKYLPQ